jgi:TatD DNase family protein
MNWLFDTHIHLSDPEYVSDMPVIIQNMKHMNTKACCVSMDFENSKETLELTKFSNLILPFIGIHPEKASDNLENMCELINDNIQKISGIGEIGLDVTFVNSDEEFQRQKLVFETMLSLAEKHDKPVSIHSRKSLDDLLEIMTSYSVKNSCLHWFDGNKKQLQKAMEMNFFISYGPVMIYANDKQILLSKTDSDKILVETDGPVKFSKCFGFKSAQVSFIPSVVFCASKILRKSYDDMCNLLENNSKRFLGI